jgi:DUF1009 family protein
MQNIGVFAGTGGMVPLVIKEIEQRSLTPVIFSFYPLKLPGYRIIRLAFGDIDGFLNAAERRGVSDFVFAGKIHPGEVFSSRMPESGRRFLESLPSYEPEVILNHLVSFLAAHNIKVLPLTWIFKEHLAKPIVYTRRKPDEEALADIRFAWRIVKKIARLRIGQAIGVKNRSVIAVEGIEGTDEMIRRCGRYCSDFTVAKAMRTGQSTRFDMPVIGPDTVRALAQARGKVLAVESGRTIITEETKTITIANENRIVILGYQAGKRNRI